MKSYDKIIVFTDGSCTNNGKKTAKGGYGVYYPSKEFPDISEPFIQEPITNQRAELYAIYCALLKITDNCEFERLYIYSDSRYSIKSVTEWIIKWEKNDWKGSNKKPIKNLDIIKPIYHILSKYPNKIKFIHVNSHVKKEEDQTIETIYNDRADKLAVLGTNKNK